ASKLTGLDDDTLARIADLYAGDALLASRLADALAANAMAAGDGAEASAMLPQAAASAGGPGDRPHARGGGRARGVSPPRGWPEVGDVRYERLGHPCQRGRGAGAARRASRRARRRTRDAASGARSRMAAHRGAARHRVRPYGGPQRHARH